MNPHSKLDLARKHSTLPKLAAFACFLVAGLFLLSSLAAHSAHSELNYAHHTSKTVAAGSHGTFTATMTVFDP